MDYGSKHLNADRSSEFSMFFIENVGKTNETRTIFIARMSHFLIRKGVVEFLP